MTLTRAFLVLSLVPVAVAVSLIVLMSYARFDWEQGLLVFGQTLPHPYIMLGNNAEYYSHWLNVIVMSGNGALAAWTLVLLAFIRQLKLPISTSWLFGTTGVAACVLIIGSLFLDSLHGEGATWIATVLYVPVLFCTYWPLYLLVQRATGVMLPAVIVCLYTALHLFLQLQYEPSHTGGPNGLFLPCALLLAFVSVSLLGLQERLGKSPHTEGAPRPAA